VEDISGAAMVKASTHQAAARKFLQFLTSEAGQSILAHSDSFEYPIHPDVSASPELPPLSSLQPTSFTAAELGTGLQAKQLLLQAGLI
jgi:iron(III) transport system substrate-binding protein